METTTKLKAIQNYLLNIPEPNYRVTNRYNGMHFMEFVKKFRGFNIKYPYKDNKKIFLIELQDNDCLIVCEIMDNICINAYIFDNDIFHTVKCHIP